MAIFYPVYTEAKQDDYLENIWSDLSNIVDGVDDTYASCAAIYSEEEEINLAASLYIDTPNTISRTDYITKVEICVTGYKDNQFDRRSDITIFDTTNDDIAFNDNFYLTSSSDEYWFDITNAPYFPGYGFWTWTDIQNLRIIFDGYIKTIHDVTTTFYIDNMKVKVTTQDDPIPRYGFRCKDENGDTTLDVTDGLSRVLYNNIFEANSTTVDVDVVVSEFSSVMGFSNALELNKIAHKIIGTNDVLNPDGTYTITHRITSQSLVVGDHTFQSSRSNVIIMGY